MQCCGVLLSCLKWFDACILRECVGHCQIVGRGDNVSFQIFLVAEGACAVAEDGLFYSKRDA